MYISGLIRFRCLLYIPYQYILPLPVSFPICSHHPSTPSHHTSDSHRYFLGKLSCCCCYKAHCYPANPSNGEVHPCGQDINWSMHGRSGKFVVSCVICMLVEGKHTQSRRVLVFSLMFFCFLHCLIFYIHYLAYFGEFWEKSALIKLLDERFLTCWVEHYSSWFPKNYFYYSCYIQTNHVGFV